MSEYTENYSVSIPNLYYRASPVHGKSDIKVMPIKCSSEVRAFMSRSRNRKGRARQLSRMRILGAQLRKPGNLIKRKKYH